MPRDPRKLKKVSEKYTRLFVDKKVIRKLLGPKPGTMPADFKIINQVISEKLRDRKFMAEFMNDYMRAGGRFKF
ncbi:MAG: hypothetical protein GY702_15545 [Desulfobulbaceae bacterium]|nr:hypothetical protein [Desulfobulbaceae bacterium]